MDETFVREALLTLLPSDETRDWDDVLHRAHALPARRRFRRPAAMALAIVGVLALIGGVAFAVTNSSQDVSAAAAATRAAALFDAGPTGEVPSSRGLREGEKYARWIRLPEVEQRLDDQEFDLGITKQGGLCIEEISYGAVQAGSGGCWGELDPSGDLQTMDGYSIGRRYSVIGLVPDSVTRVTLHTPDGDFDAQIGDDIVTWRAPATHPTLVPTGATVQLANGSSFEVGSELSLMK